MAESPFLVHFGQPHEKTSVCGKYALDAKDLESLAAAVEDNFYFELVIG
ncbi:unnamed protein product [Gongylonema pulchrum]|uniref:Acetyltransferase n=1 Tax=Gongylonema pulchrum TaxID=637853 RepID=A0A183EV65_9BILA|nr:unnamed protein product [Gongylonema pulchrum]